MSFSRKLVAGLVTGGILLTLSAVSFASDTGKVEKSLKENFPQVKFDTVLPTEIPGLYEVDAGQNIFYYYPDKEIVFVGELVGKDLKSKTSERRGTLAAKAVKDLPLDKAVKIGDGKFTVVEFTDPDCPYCRKAYTYFTKRTDVTQYIFFAPLAHPQAIGKVEYILGAKNKAEAYDAMMLGQEIPASAPPPSAADKALAQEHLALSRKVGIQGTPTFFINGQMVVGADTKKFDDLLK